MLTTLKALHARTSALEVEMAIKSTEVEQLRQLFNSHTASRAATRPQTPTQSASGHVGFAANSQNGPAQYQPYQHVPEYSFGIPLMGSPGPYGPATTPPVISHSYSYPGFYSCGQAGGIFDPGHALGTMAEFEPVPRSSGGGALPGPTTSPQRTQRASFSHEQPPNKVLARQRGMSHPSFPSHSFQMSRSSSVSRPDSCQLGNRY